jgi:zinc protease
MMAVWFHPETLLRAADSPPTTTKILLVPELKIEKYRLDNGLTVILHEDHKTPLVAINIVYNVGSNDDKPGRTGLAHLLEHMMFEGSLHSEQQFEDALSKYVDPPNATTEWDRTVYHETVTTDALERALWLEADRMGFLLPVLTQVKLDVVRNIVKNERRSHHDNVPFGAVAEVHAAALYPPGHPYRHLTIGSMTDLSSATVGDMRAFFEHHYVPNNAYLCIAGDFRPADARRWIKKYFGLYRRGAGGEPPRGPQVPRLSGPKRISLVDQASHAYARLVWPTVSVGHRDEPALDILAAILGGLDNQNRLFRRLIFDHELSIQVGAFHSTHLLSGEFQIDLYAEPGQSLADLVRIADQQIELLKKEGPTDVEVQSAQNQREHYLILGLESVTSKAAILCKNAASVGDPLGYLGTIERIRAVTSVDVARVARQYLGANRIELDVIPGAPAARLEDVAVEREKPVLAPDPFELDEISNHAVMPELAPMPSFVPPGFIRRRLSNGLHVRIVERHELPVVTVALVVRSGETSTPLGKEGLCSITAALMGEATKSRDAINLACALSEMGATLSTNGWLESMEVRLTVLSRHLERSLDLFADVITSPSFAETDLERLKRRRAAELKVGESDTERIADEVFDRLIYPPQHLYSRPFLGTTESIASISRADVLAFYKKVLVPTNSEVVVVGDIRADDIVAALETRLLSWPPGPTPLPQNLSQPSPMAQSPLYLIDRPRATQSIVTIGRVGISGKAKDYDALDAIAVTLGGSSSGLINWNLRDEKGFTYGLSSEFVFRRGPARFVLTGPVQTSATAESLVELMKEMTDLAGARALDDDDIAVIEASRIPILCGRYETAVSIADRIRNLIIYDLEDDYDAKLLKNGGLPKKAEIDRVAKQYLKPEEMTILVVGDRSQIEGQLKRLPFVSSIRLLDARGNPLPEPVSPKPAPAGLPEGGNKTSIEEQD